ncbi:polysaccharide pyruvyl transferase family protein [Microbacterium ureisolvens]|uniref:polysaccharide pyruvyl transferase family protein n=1 Tax=Microbacterium ureisolvens TaxID=2781186 RepID=UPI00363BE274
MQAPEVALCWAASTPWTQGHANLGDSLSAVVVAALSGRLIRHFPFEAERTKLVAVGTIGDEIRNGTAVVWGTGVPSRREFSTNSASTRYDVRAVRGPVSARNYRSWGIQVPDVYGDPAWFVPSIIAEPAIKRFELGVIPHISEVSAPRSDAPSRDGLFRYAVDGADGAAVAIINTWHHATWEGLLATVQLIRSCRRIVSRSFHGVVLAEAYGIPVLPLSEPVDSGDGVQMVSLTEPASVDERVWEFYATGRRKSFPVYAQSKTHRTDWQGVLRAVDRYWIPHQFDAEPLAAAFPLPLAYDPLTKEVASLEKLQKLTF